MKNNELERVGCMKETSLCFVMGAVIFINRRSRRRMIITLRFRTAKDDVDRVRLMTGVGGYDMKKESTRGEFDYYTINWRLNEEPFRYCFEIQDGDEPLLLQQVRHIKRNCCIL